LIHGCPVPDGERVAVTGGAVGQPQHIGSHSAGCLASIAEMRLAMPDMDLLTFPEMADAVDPPLCPAGAAAMLIKDKVWPRRLGSGDEGARRVGRLRPAEQILAEPGRRRNISARMYHQDSKRLQLADRPSAYFAHNGSR
jgi:hypothetical protein